VRPPQFEFLFDFSSPYSYLAATQVPALEERLGLRALWRPMLLGAVFKATGNRMPASIPAKARNLMSDLARWAEFYQVPIRYPDWFPGNSLLPSRVAIAGFGLGEEVGRRFCAAAFRAAWVDNVDLSVPEAVIECANMCGLRGEELVRAATTQEVKDALRAVTDGAIARGVYGAPSFFVEGELFWGNDRIAFVEDALVAHQERAAAQQEQT
jgi:2-hydroxychromene-2-carboxylate isomerase